MTKREDKGGKAGASSTALARRQEARDKASAHKKQGNRGAKGVVGTKHAEDAARWRSCAERLAARAADPNTSPSALVQAYLQATETGAEANQSALLAVDLTVLIALAVNNGGAECALRRGCCVVLQLCVHSMSKWRKLSGSCGN